MQKLIYKDEVYYYERWKHDSQFTTQYGIKIRVERKGFWKWLFPYKTIIKAKGYSYIDDGLMCERIDVWKTKISDLNKHPKPLIINCSDEITSLYKNERKS